MQVEREQSRQTWLAAFGLTPWVASRRLPGARASQLLSLVTDEEIATPEPVSLAAAITAPETAAETPATPIVAVPANTPVVAQEKAAPTTQLSAPRLCLYQSAQTLVIVEQQDRQAPELGREEQQLLRALLQVFGMEHRHHPFLCPRQPQQARDTLAAFVDGLALQGCTRVLLCLEDAACAHLLGDQPPYQAFTLGRLPALVISSLGQMLIDPLIHKKKSWHSICEAGFDQ